MREGNPLPHQLKICSFHPLPRKISPPTKFSFCPPSFSFYHHHHHQKSTHGPPLNNSYNPIKTAFLANVIVPVPFRYSSNFILFGHLGHVNFDFNWCSVFTESYFKLWKRFKSPKPLLLRFPSPGKKKSP